MTAGFHAFRLLLVVGFVALCGLIVSCAALWGEDIADRNRRGKISPGLRIVWFVLGVLALLLFLTLVVFPPDTVDIAFGSSHRLGLNHTVGRLAGCVVASCLFGFLCFASYKRASRPAGRSTSELSSDPP